MKSAIVERKEGRLDIPSALTYLAMQNYGSKVVFIQEIRAYLGPAIDLLWGTKSHCQITGLKLSLPLY